MGSRPMHVITAVQVPRECHCAWTARYQNTGGDVRVEWLLVGVDPICKVHKWLGSQGYPVVKDS